MRVSLKYMLDTNIFNRLIDNCLPDDFLTSRIFVATHIQRDELAMTKSDERRIALMAAFHEIVQEQVPTSSAVFDVSNWDESCWTSESSKYDEMLNRLKVLDTLSKKKPKNPEMNRARDVLIAETAILNNCSLLTADHNLSKLCLEFGGSSELID